MGMVVAHLGRTHLTPAGIMKYATGIDLGGSFVKYALVDEAGHALLHGKTPSYAQESAGKIIAQIVAATGIVREYAEANRLSLAGVGIGTPGIVDEQTGVVLGGAENLKDWENIPLAAIVAEATRLPVAVNNDANVAGWAEAVFGAARGCSDVVVLTIGTGIGGAIVINGQLFGGYRNRGAELGHVPLFADGELCACGSTGCLEHYASAAALVRRFRAHVAQRGATPPDDVDGETIVRLYHQGDASAVASIHENCRFLGHAIGGFIHIFSPQKVIIGGGLADAGDFYIERIRQEVARYVIRDCAVHTTIQRAALGNRAGCLGAAGLILHPASL
jgi:glucokinase